MDPHPYSSQTISAQSQQNSNFKDKKVEKDKKVKSILGNPR